MRKIEVSKRDILTDEEARKLFNCDDIWENKKVYLACKMSLCMGLRKGEILALRKEDILDDIISIKRNYSKCYGMIKYTSCDRKVPVVQEIKTELDELMKSNHGDFLFSSCCGFKPMSPNTIVIHFVKALRKIGISDAERNKRGLCFHTLRMTFINLLKRLNFADWKIYNLTGVRKTNRLPLLYHYDKIIYDDVLDFQKMMFAE